MQSSLLQRTLELASARDEPVSDIADKSGIPRDWLYAFVNGKIEKPNVIYVEALYTYLSKRPLKLS